MAVIKNGLLGLRLLLLLLLCSNFAGASSIAKVPRVAVAWDRSLTELFVAAGIVPVAVASSHEFPSYLTRALGNLDGIVDLGSHREINIEALLAARPDLIVMQSVDQHGSQQFYQLAREIAPVIQLDSSVGLRQLIRDFGKLMGQPYAERLNRRVDAAVATMAAATDRPASLSISNAMLLPGSIRLYKDNSNLASQLLKEAGFKRPLSQRSGSEKIVNNGTEISVEQLDLIDGDILFLGKIGSASDLGGITSTRLWQSLSVVSAGRVVEVDWRYWNGGGPLAAEFIAADFVRALARLQGASVNQ